jgi:hypothetical protein
LCGQAYSFEAGAADHVDGQGADAIGEAAAESGLARGVLAKARGENAAHEALVDEGAVDASAIDGGAHSEGSELHGRERRETAEELSDWRTHGADDDDFTHELAPSPRARRRTDAARVVYVAMRRVHHWHMMR